MKTSMKRFIRYAGDGRFCSELASIYNKVGDHLAGISVYEF